MAAQDSNSPTLQPTPTVGSTPPKDKKSAMREDWNKMSKEHQDSLIQSMSAEDQVKFANDMGWYGHATGIQAAPTAGSIPWMKEKAQQFLTWGANQLPTVGGVTGGLVGGAIGGAANPAGGEFPGAIVGSGIGGGTGEAARQYIEHKRGYDQYETPESKTVGHRTLDVVKEGIGQAAGELSGQALGKWLRPTIDRSIAKLYYAGNLKYGDPLGKGDLQKVFDDIVKTENATGKAVNVKDFINVINSSKNDIGQEVDKQLALPIVQNGKQMMLGQAHADAMPIVTSIQNMATADPSIVKRAQLNPAGKEAAYLEHIRREALAFSQHPWTYQELTSERIRLNNELAPLYELPTAGDKRVYLLDHPHLAVAKAEADAIRDVVYPKMDILSGKPAGTTAELQGKRGALISLENQVTTHLGDLKTKTLQARGAPPLDKVNISTYGTSTGKPGFAFHRLTGLVHTPNPEAKAGKQVAKAFGHGVGPNTRRIIASPFGSDKLGNELLSMPVRELQKKINEHFDPHQKQDDDEDTEGGQSSVAPVASPKELLDQAKRRNPVANGQVAYNHVAVNPATGHRIGSNGSGWFDVQTGQQVA